MMLMIITTKQDWQKAQDDGVFSHDSLESEGFIHCSYPHQIDGVVSRYYADVPDLLLLTVDPEKLESKVIDEDTKNSGELFPHIYGQIPLDAVVDVREYQPNVGRAL